MTKVIRTVRQSRKPTAFPGVESASIVVSKRPTGVAPTGFAEEPQYRVNGSRKTQQQHSPLLRSGEFQALETRSAADVCTYATIASAQTSSSTSASVWRMFFPGFDTTSLPDD